MSLGLPDASDIFGKGGDVLRSVSDFNKATEYGLLGAGLGEEARQRASEYRRKALEEQSAINARQSWTSGLIDAGTSLASAGLSAGLKSWSANRPTMGSGEVSAPSIDVANPTAGERALMDAKYKLHGW